MKKKLYICAYRNGEKEKIYIDKINYELFNLKVLITLGLTTYFEKYIYSPVILYMSFLIDLRF